MAESAPALDTLNPWHAVARQRDPDDDTEDVYVSLGRKALHTGHAHLTTVLTRDAAASFVHARLSAEDTVFIEAGTALRPRDILGDAARAMVRLCGTAAT